MLLPLLASVTLLVVFLLFSRHPPRQHFIVRKPFRRRAGAAVEPAENCDGSTLELPAIDDEDSDELAIFCLQWHPEKTAGSTLHRVLEAQLRVNNGTYEMAYAASAVLQRWLGDDAYARAHPRVLALINGNPPHVPLTWPDARALVAAARNVSRGGGDMLRRRLLLCPMIRDVGERFVSAARFYANRLIPAYSTLDQLVDALGNATQEAPVFAFNHVRAPALRHVRAEWAWKIAPEYFLQYYLDSRASSALLTALHAAAAAAPSDDDDSGGSGAFDALAAPLFAASRGGGVELAVHWFVAERFDASLAVLAALARMRRFTYGAHYLPDVVRQNRGRRRLRDADEQRVAARYRRSARLEPAGRRLHQLAQQQLTRRLSASSASFRAFVDAFLRMRRCAAPPLNDTPEPPLNYFLLARVRTQQVSASAFLSANQA